MSTIIIKNKRHVEISYICYFNESLLAPLLPRFPRTYKFKPSTFCKISWSFLIYFPDFFSLMSQQKELIFTLDKEYENVSRVGAEPNSTERNCADERVPSRSMAVPGLRGIEKLMSTFCLWSNTIPSHKREEAGKGNRTFIRCIEILKC